MKRVSGHCSLAGTIVFSKQPIAPANPQNLTGSFRAGDHIYGLMMPQKTWREIYGESAEQKAGLLLQWKIDDTERVGGYINVVPPPSTSRARPSFSTLLQASAR